MGNMLLGKAKKRKKKDATPVTIGLLFHSYKVFSVLDSVKLHFQ